MFQGHRRLSARRFKGRELVTLCGEGFRAMARMCAHAHSSPTSRHLGAPSPSLLEGFVARRSVSASSRSASSSSASAERQSPSPCRVASSSSAAQRGQHVQAKGFSLSAAGGFIFCRHRLGRVSSSALGRLSGMERLSQISTVAGRATAGSEVGLGSESKHKGREVLVQHLLVKADDVQLLIELQRRLIQEGLDLSDLAGEHSICPSKDQGGMLGWIKVGQTTSLILFIRHEKDVAFEEAAFNAPLNKVVRVKTQHGLHLLQVLNERKAHFLEQLQAEELHERMQEPTFLEESQLIDVREPHEISTAAIKGFEAYPLSDFGKWAPNIADDLDPEKDTYVLCHHGVRSMQAANWLQSQGFTRLYNISGGIHAYATKVDRSIPTY